jgi:CubicO group peptidase (beta-lactamase class C family)
MIKNLKKYRRGIFLNFLFILLFFMLTSNVNLIFRSNYRINSFFLKTSQSEQDYWPINGWITTSPEEQGMNSKKLSEMHTYIEEEAINIRSVIVVRNGYIVEEGYLTNCKFRTVREDYGREQHRLWSVTKSITSLCIGMVIQKGYINNISQTFFEFFPELWKPTYDLRKKNVTIEHLLTMTSGIEWDESSMAYSDPSNDYNKMIHTTNWVQYYLDKPMLYDPGEFFSYSAGSSMLLSALIQKLTNQTTSEFAHDFLFIPLGILKEHWRWDADPAGITDGADGLSMTPKDMAKIGLLLINNGTWEGMEIVPTDYVKAASIDQQPPLSDSTYGYQFWVQSWFPYYAYAAIGWNGQRIVIFPEINLIVTFTADITNYNYYLDYIIEEFIIASIDIGPDLSNNNISSFPFLGFWVFFSIGIFGTGYFLYKKRRLT